MAIDKSLVPNVTDVDLDAFVSGSQVKQKAEQSESNDEQVPAATQRRKKDKTPAKPEKKLAKSKDPNYHKLTLYLPKELISQLKIAVASETEKDISEVSADLYAAYILKAVKKMLKEFN